MAKHSLTICKRFQTRARVAGRHEPGVVDVGRVGRHRLLKRGRKKRVEEIEINRGGQFATGNDDETQRFWGRLERPPFSRTVQSLPGRRRLHAPSLVKELCAKGEKSEMFAFASPYARSFLTQLRCLIQRASLAHNRDVAYNLGRIGILFVLYLLFGFVYLI